MRQGNREAALSEPVLRSSRAEVVEKFTLRKREVEERDAGKV